MVMKVYGQNGVMAIKKRMFRCSTTVKCVKHWKTTSRSFTRSMSPHWKFLVSQEGFDYVARQGEKKKKVGRVVSLSIDLHGISELDRDAVIAPKEEKKKICLWPELHYDFPERNFLISMRKCRAMHEKLVSSLTAVSLALTYLTEGL